jgi:RNA polymerase sigma factor (sigma-70 family)
VDDAEPLYQELLVVRCQLGDRQALAELVARWERPLLFYVRRLMPDGRDPLQVMQDVWVKVLGQIGSLRDPARLAPWLYTLARNAVMDRLREHYRREPLAEPAWTAEEVATADDGMGWFVAAEQVHYGLSRVSVVDREVLTLYFLSDLSVGDIADVLRIPPGTVKSRLFHARSNLRKVLQTQEGAER